MDPFYFDVLFLIILNLKCFWIKIAFLKWSLTARQKNLQFCLFLIMWLFNYWELAYFLPWELDVSGAFVSGLVLS